MQTAAGVGALLGRDVEFALLRAFLERRPEDGAAALLLEGEPGIGKTAMWRAATEAARASALRRLAAQPLCVVMTERTGSDAALGHEVARAVPCERLALGPLSLGAVRRLLQERLDAAFPRPILRRIYDQSGGNAFF